ncbi:MAG: PAS domain-containing protein [Kouleothrix sp.]
MIPTDEEVAALAQDFNLMASRLRQLLVAVETERQRLATLLATMADGILLLRDDDTVLLANHAAAELLALKGEEAPIALAAVPIGDKLQPAVQAIHCGQMQERTLVVEEVLVPLRSARCAR